jgi:protein-disulfide isomerase
VTSVGLPPGGGPDEPDAQPSPSQRQGKRRLQVRAAVLVLILVVVALGVLIQRDMAATETSAYYGPYAPVTLTAGDTETMTQPGVTKPVLAIYEDYQCSICDQFELANGGLVQQLADQGRVKVIYHLFTIFVGSQPRQANSTRAWTAARCVPARSWLRYHNLLYSHQPAENDRDGFPIAQLLALGQQIGLTMTAFAECVTSQRSAAQLVPLSNRIFKSGITATPTVKLNGRPLSLSTLVSRNGDLTRAILAAR